MVSCTYIGQVDRIKTLLGAPSTSPSRLFAEIKGWRMTAIGWRGRWSSYGVCFVTARCAWLRVARQGWWNSEAYQLRDTGYRLWVMDWHTLEI